jgi:hypothetical protein
VGNRRNAKTLRAENNILISNRGQSILTVLQIGVLEVILVKERSK